MLYDPFGDATKSATDLIREYQKDSLNADSLQPATKKTSDSSKSVAAKAIAEAVPKLTQDSLAKIGGFTGRAGEELKSIQFKQLSELQRIQSNTESLKGGVR